MSYVGHSGCICNVTNIASVSPVGYGTSDLGACTSPFLINV